LLDDLIEWHVNEVSASERDIHLLGHGTDAIDNANLPFGSIYVTFFTM